MARRFGLRISIWGMLAFASPWIGLTPVTALMGAISIGAGITTVLSAFEAQTWGKGMIPLLLGLIGGATGICLLIWPEMTPVDLTALLATYFVLRGGLTLAFGWRLRLVSGWIRFLVVGSSSLLLAASIWYQLPWSGPRAVGLLVGIELLAMGAALVGLQGFGGPEMMNSTDDRDMAI